ncbi:MAG: iron hydrogenase small subunit [Kiritimatiellae bacterium]|nr:iron hydrogenase small subunit [Kiritimatiellia bacterium]
MEMIKLEVNGVAVEVPKGSNLLVAAQAANVKIPTLCYHPDLKPGASCGICVVRQLVPSRTEPGKFVPSPKLLGACCTEATEGMKIVTHDPDIVQVRRTVLELILANHPQDCLQCPRSGRCELQDIAADFGIREIPFPKEVIHRDLDKSTPSLVLNPDKCIKCGRCAEVCQQMQNVWALEFIGRGEKTVMAPAAGVKLAESPCIKCGQCSAHCPVGAIYENDETAKVWAALRDTEKTCLVQIAPAVRVALGEAFGMKPGELTTGKIYAALRMLGFKKVFDTNFSADVTIMEEGTEFIKRFTNGGKLPLITSCCPAWTDWMEKYAPDFTENFSSAKSPQQMLSALAKTYWAEKNGLTCDKVHVTSIMPCTAKKYEITRDEHMKSTGCQDTDVVLTTRELARMIKAAGIDFLNLPEEKADDLLGSYTGAGTIFGVTGGVMEAALRTAYCLITKEDQPPAIEFTAVRGMDGVKKATIDIKGTQVNIAVAHQMGNVEKVLNEVREDIKNGVKPRYDFIEVMACRGGCVGGGGQPCLATDAVRAARTAGLYSDDEKSTLRMSHLNPEVQALYKDYLGEPGSEKAEHLLHTDYRKRDLYRFAK